LAAARAAVSHDHPDAIAAAQAVALSIFLLQKNVAPRAVRERLIGEFRYDLSPETALSRGGTDVSAAGRFCSLIPGFGVKLSAINPCRAHCSLRGRGLPSAIALSSDMSAAITRAPNSDRRLWLPFPPRSDSRWRLGCWGFQDRQSHKVGLGLVARKNPIRATLAGRCPRAASGQATAAPPSSVMNSRRFIRSPRRRGR
jgi:hypothetical protein